MLKNIFAENEKLARGLQETIQAPRTNAGGITAFHARGCGFESRLCRQHHYGRVAQLDRARIFLQP